MTDRTPEHDVPTIWSARFGEVEYEAAMRYQVATGLRPWLIYASDGVITLLRVYQSSLLNPTRRHAEKRMPRLNHLEGTHLMTFGHPMLAWFEVAKTALQELRAMLERAVSIDSSDEPARESLRICNQVIHNLEVIASQPTGRLSNPTFPDRQSDVGAIPP